MSHMTEDQFFDHYKPIKNPLNANAPYDGCMFETYGQELGFVMSQDTNKTWTIVEGDNGNIFYMAGYHLVNRLGYFVTEVPWETGEEEIECEGIIDGEGD